MKTSSNNLCQMKSMIARLLLTFAFAAVAPFAWGAPGDGIAGSAHDFGTGLIAGETPGTCTYCHTPHMASNQALLWNQQAQSTTYSWTNAATTGGTAYASIVSATNIGPSVKCLSCHDGTTTAGDMGWFNATADPGGSTNVTVTADYVVGTIAGDMDGNHPVSMPFPLGGVASTYNGSTTGASALLSDWVADPEAVGIRLFSDNLGVGATIQAGGLSGEAGIECSSCHDPHNGGSVKDVFLLRGDLGAGGGDTYICAKCHNR